MSTADDAAAPDGSETTHCDEPLKDQQQKEDDQEEDDTPEEGGKEVAAIRTILAGRRRQFSNGGAPMLTAGALDDDDQAAPAPAAAAKTIVVKPKQREGGERYRFTQPNEPESAQWVDDGGRRSQGARFERGHSQRFSELRCDDHISITV